MWIPKEFKTKPKKMDFSSLGQSTVDVTALYADGENLMNAIELMEFDCDPIQFQICDHCGYPGCSSGDWLSIRKIGESVIILPAFTVMDDGEWESSEYDPPYFTRIIGSILLKNGKYEEFRNLVKGIPALSEVKKISSYEISRLLQWEAPFRMFGDYPNPITIKSDLLCTTSLQSDEMAVDALVSLMNHFQSSKLDIDLIPISVEDEKISFFLEGTDFIEWVPMVKRNNGFGLILGSEYSIIEVGQG